MEDRDYFDFLHQGWSKTTGAKDCFWMPEESLRGTESMFDLYAVDEQQEKKHLASYLSEEDAAFIVAVHGSWPDLFRKLHSSMDEAESKDLLADENINRVYSLELEIQKLKEIIRDLEDSR